MPPSHHRLREHLSTRVLALVSTLLAAGALLIGTAATPAVATAVHAAGEAAEAAEAEAEETTGRHRDRRRRGVRSVIRKVTAARPTFTRRRARPTRRPRQRLRALRSTPRRGPPALDD